MPKPKSVLAGSRDQYIV